MHKSAEKAVKSLNNLAEQVQAAGVEFYQDEDGPGLTNTFDPTINAVAQMLVDLTDFLDVHWIDGRFVRDRLRECTRDDLDYSDAEFERVKRFARELLDE